MRRVQPDRDPVKGTVGPYLGTGRCLGVVSYVARPPAAYTRTVNSAKEACAGWRSPTCD